MASLVGVQTGGLGGISPTDFKEFQLRFSAYFDAGISAVARLINTNPSSATGATNLLRLQGGRSKFVPLHEHKVSQVVGKGVFTSCTVKT